MRNVVDACKFFNRFFFISMKKQIFSKPRWMTSVCNHQHGGSVGALVWGHGDLGQLGLGNSVFLQPSPKLLRFDASNEESECCIDRIICGVNHTIAISHKGDVFVFGRGENGQLGLGDTMNRFVPTVMKKISSKRVGAVACGGHHSLCSLVIDNGKNFEFYAWGRNMNGQLGLGTFSSLPVTVPTEITAFKGKPITSIACGEDFSLVVVEEREVYMFGKADAGQHPENASRQDFEDKAVPQLILNWKHGIAKVSCGWGHCALLTKNGEVFTWGANLHAQCGQGKKSRFSPLLPVHTNNIRIVDIECGSCHTVLLSEQGEVFLFGSGADGKMAFGEDDPIDILRPRKVNFFSERKVKIVQIRSGTDHICTLDEDGNMWNWGFGQHGALGFSSLKTLWLPQRLKSPIEGTYFSEISCGMDITITLISKQPPQSSLITST